jgi:hypothetical protein
VHCRPACVKYAPKSARFLTAYERARSKRQDDNVHHAKGHTCQQAIARSTCDGGESDPHHHGLTAPSTSELAPLNAGRLVGRIFCLHNKTRIRVVRARAAVAYDPACRFCCCPPGLPGSWSATGSAGSTGPAAGVP